ncbi:MAG: hypothetical protein IJC88_01800 [Oscillospiraceae bacterium]|nr:hypothetical protein [Oscillospiraceae bacterium]
MNPITREIKTENGDCISIVYEVIEDRMRKNYGLRLRETRISPERTTEIPEITGNLLEIQHLVMVLSTCSVTSATVHDILEDYRAARI